MINQQIVAYIQQQLKAGYDLTSIKNFLLQQGYIQKDVDESAGFVDGQRLSSLTDYIRNSLGSGADPDTIRSQLLSSGYPMPDINEALNGAQKSPSRLPTSNILIILVALVIFGLGLFFFWPKAGGTTLPSVTEKNVETKSAPSIAFETKPAADTEKSPEQKTEAAGSQEDVSNAEDAKFKQEFSASQEVPQEKSETAVTAETSDFENLIDKASKESNADNALAICDKAENSVYKDACYDQISKTFDSSAICAKIQDESLRDSCYLNIVLKNKDYSLCENIVDSSLHDSCVSMSQTPKPENTTVEDIQQWGA